MSDVSETDELVEYARTARAWIEANLEPEDEPRADIDHDSPEYVPGQRQLQRRLFDAGYAGISWPREYGGQGLSSAHERAFYEQATGFRLPDEMIRTFGIIWPTILLNASPAFLARHAEAVLRGDALIWCQFFSEPDAGSDLAGVRTRATRDGDRWLLNGSKIWSSSAHLADYGFCLARTNWDVPKHRGLTWFAVKLGTPGITVNRIRQINGESEFCQVFFDNVEVSDDDVVGVVNEGWTVAQSMFVFERRWGRSDATDANHPLHQLDPVLRSLVEDRGLQHRADIRQLVARSLINDVVQAELGLRIRALSMLEGADPSSLAAYIKVAMGIFGPIRARMKLQIAGAVGLTWAKDEPSAAPTVVSEYLFARVQAIAGGTHQVMSNVIGERVLGLPREPSFDRDLPFSEVLRRAAQWSSGSVPAR
jgi:alkylation response protein AidB-like acyl-CoA dehydrogenase